MNSPRGYDASGTDRANGTSGTHGRIASMFEYCKFWRPASGDGGEERGGDNREGRERGEDEDETDWEGAGLWALVLGGG